MDVDPEIVRKGVRSLMQQVAQIERERVCNYKLFEKYNGMLEVGQSLVVVIISTFKRTYILVVTFHAHRV